MFNSKLILLGALFVLGTVHGSTQMMNKLFAQQKASVSKLRDILLNKLPEPYMKEDYWLANWLTANEFNVNNTAQEIGRYLELRTHLNVATIMEENWSDMRTLFPYARNTTDRSGKPLLYINMGGWDIASFLSTENGPYRLLRYVTMMLEESEAQVRQLRAEGRNVSQFTVLGNVGGFQLSKHVCMQCVSFYRNSAKFLIPYAAVNIEKSVFVNVHYAFKMAYLLFTTSDTRNVIQLHGQDLEELRKMLDTYIDPDQIPYGILDGVAEEDNSEGSTKWEL